MPEAATRLLRGHVPSSGDSRVREALEGLPAVESADDAPVYVGILNEAGATYREVVVQGSLQLLHLTARLNAGGFRAIHQRGLGRSRYAVLFAPAPPEVRPGRDIYNRGV